MKRLHILHRLTNLTKLYFDRCDSLTDSGIEKLRLELPDCEIYINAYTF